MASVVNDIKNGNIAGMYLFCGEEAFKRRNYKELLKNSVTNGNMMNYAEFEGKDIEWQSVYDAVVTMPFFAAKRLVVIENSGKFKAKKGDEGQGEAKNDNTSSMLEKILNDKPETTCLAFFEESAAKNKKIYKAIASKGLVCECNADTEEDLINWLAKGFAREGKKIRKSTLQLMVGRVGLEYDRLRTEFEKVVSYTWGRDIVEDADVMAVTSETTESKIFELLSAMSEKNIGKALDRYHDLLVNREHPLYIMAMLRSQFRVMLQVAEFAGRGMSSFEISKAVGRPTFAVNNMKNYLRHFSADRLEKILDEISDIDRRCKSGEIQDQIGVEMLIIKFSA